MKRAATGYEIVQDNTPGARDRTQWCGDRPERWYEHDARTQLRFRPGAWHNG
jgi:hypothetical protein